MHIPKTLISISGHCTVNIRKMVQPTERRTYFCLELLYVDEERVGGLHSPATFMCTYKHYIHTNVYMRITVLSKHSRINESMHSKKLQRDSKLTLYMGRTRVCSSIHAAMSWTN